MNNKITKYWKWNESFNNSAFKLGLNIDSIPDGLICNAFNNNEVYIIKSGMPQSIVVRDKQIKKLNFRDSFFTFHDVNLWEMEYRDFVLNIEKYLTPIDDDTSGDILCVIFREFHPAIAFVRRA